MSNREETQKLTAINDGDSHENTGSAPDGSREISSNREQAEDGASESSSRWDDALELLVHRTLTVTRHHHLLILQLLGNVAGARAGDFNPSLGEECTCREHEGDVDGSVDGVEDGFLDGVGGRHVVGHSRGSA